MDGDDPRGVLARHATGQNSLGALSRMIGRNEAYLHQFVRRGTPRRLAERDRRLLADHLGLSEESLGAPAPRETGWITVPRHPAFASAGPGSLVDDEVPVGADRFDPALIRRLRVDPARAATIRVRGASMAPGIHDGDVLLVDGARRTPDGAVFLVRLNGALMVKRAERGSRGVLLSSDSPEHPIGAYDPREVAVLGRVAWLGRAPA